MVKLHFEVYTRIWKDSLRMLSALTTIIGVRSGMS